MLRAGTKKPSQRSMVATICPLSRAYSNKVAGGFLSPCEEAILLTGILELANLVADVLEARENAAHLKATSTCHIAGKS